MTSAPEILMPLEKWQASAWKQNDVPRERAFRVYTEQHGASIAFQIRTPLRLADRGEGKDFVIAHAQLTLDQLKQLRADIDALIAYNEGP